MEINNATLKSAGVGFNAAFARGLASSSALKDRIATTVLSTTKTNEYGWLGKAPRFREWLGDRVINAIAKHGYTLTNRSFENTIGVDRDDFDDDNLGIYGPLFEELGNAAQTFPDELIFELLKLGFSSLCYDGQYFFDTDHVVLDALGKPTSVANTDGGSGLPWFLMDVSRPLKPLIFQSRKPFTNLIRKDKEDDDNAFFRKEYIYGIDGRCQVGFGFWQQAWGSKQTLNAANYETARVAISSMKADYGRPLNLNPRLLVVPPALEGVANGIIKSALVNGGETNKWAGTAEVMVVPLLA
ncbi:Mu-like prophage major head subunit gpT family protein [Rhizobium sp. 9140]|uniref:Mu-like prophage major head subunit gpT family protein n=1 Tax=Rhizobium sp. 9140 TaxID=1761900 RepID=UPI0007972E2C|nr:Mu-like prophage major head subunit gpT family protein [Rhizobium sp. 9140]CZT33000.1 Mu-like prophage major head subunit gpT [Rhizobium sp. 9140]